MRKSKDIRRLGQSDLSFSVFAKGQRYSACLRPYICAYIWRKTLTGTLDHEDENENDNLSYTNQQVK